LLCPLAMFEAVLAVKPPSSWVLEISANFNTPIRILDCIPHGREGGQGLFEIPDHEGKGELIERIRAHPDVERVDLVTDEDGVAGSVTVKRWLACSLILQSDCYLKGAIARSDGWTEWHVVTKDNAILRQLIKQLEESGCKVHLLRKRRLVRTEGLTKRQETVLREALGRGYYDFPRRITGAQLASRLGLAPSTLSEILQRSERKLVEFYLRNRF
jgi:predicted DNA binding protein